MRVPSLMPAAAGPPGSGPSERLSGAEVEPKRLLGHGEVEGDVSPGLPAHHESQPDAPRRPQVVEEILSLVEEPQVAHRCAGEGLDVGEDHPAEEPVAGDA